MERVSVLCLLFLCSLSGADLMNSGNSEQREGRPESGNVPEQTQAGPSDVHGALRDLTAKLAVLQTKMEQLQTLNQEQAVKLKELELQASEVEALKQKQQAQAMEVDTLKQRQQVGQVAFSASLLASGSGNVGPFNTHTNLVFKHIFSNIGSAYNPNTGFFTAPVKGAYHFQFHVGAIGDPSVGSVAVLVKNGQNICNAYEHQTNGFGTSANGATLLLETGDVVSLRLWEHTIIHDSENHHSTFTGFLLFPL